MGMEGEKRHAEMDAVSLTMAWPLSATSLVDFSDNLIDR